MNVLCKFSLNIFTVPYACWTFTNGIEVVAGVLIAWGALMWFLMN